MSVRILALLLFYFSVTLPCGWTAELQPFAFRLASLTVVQKAGYSSSGEFSWNPRLNFESELGFPLGATLNLGIGHVKGAGSDFILVEAELLATYAIDASWVLELGGGLQSWRPETALAPKATAGVAWVLASPTFGPSDAEDVFEMLGDVVHEIFLNYSSVFAPRELTHTFKIGVGFGF